MSNSRILFIAGGCIMYMCVYSPFFFSFLEKKKKWYVDEDNGGEGIRRQQFNHGKGEKAKKKEAEGK